MRQRRQHLLYTKDVARCLQRKEHQRLEEIRCINGMSTGLSCVMVEALKLLHNYITYKMNNGEVGVYFTGSQSSIFNSINQNPYLT
jgi:hypothetical protein